MLDKVLNMPLKHICKWAKLVNGKPEACSEPSRTFKIEALAKIVNW